MADEGDKAQAWAEQQIADALAHHKRNHPARHKPPPPDGHPLLNQGGGRGVVICIDCEEEIPARRRQVQPDCCRCVECQEQFERSLKGR